MMVLTLEILVASVTVFVLAIFLGFRINQQGPSNVTYSLDVRR